MKKASDLFLIILLIFIPFGAYAIRVPGLYQAEVFVTDQAVNNRQTAMATAMQRVLVKLTGDRNAGDRLELRPIINNAEDYVLQYRYLEPSEDLRFIGEGNQLTLNIRFDEVNLNNALRNLGIQVWSRERPSTLVWIAKQDETSRSIIQPEISPEVFNELEDRASERGIVIINPLFDLQDNSALRASDVWGEFHFSIKNASERYYPDIILTGKIQSPVPGIWEGYWSVYLDEKIERFSTQGSYIEAVLSEGIDGLTDIIVANYSTTVMADIGSKVLKVIDVITVEQYAKVLKYFQSLSPVTDVEVLQISPGQVEFRIQAHGGDSAVIQAINFGRVLEPIGNDPDMFRVLP